jgi:hypothetical protein
MSIASSSGGGGAGEAHTQCMEVVPENPRSIRISLTNGFYGDSESSLLCLRSYQLSESCAKTEPAGVRC